MKRSAVLTTLVFVALFAGPIGAQDDALIRVVPKEGGWEVEELIKTVGAYTGITMVYDPHNPMISRKRIEFGEPAKLKKEQIFDWFRSVLFTSRIVLVPTGPSETRTYNVVDLNSPNVVQHPTHVSAESLEAWKDRDGAYIVTTIPVKHMHDTSRARNALAQLSTRQIGRINDTPSSRAFVVGDFAPTVWAMKKLIDQLDADAASTPAALRAALDPQIKQYEQKLAQCQTSEAAIYFIKRIEALIPKK